jgi:hypothetical protein
MGSALDTEVMNADPETATLITDYVAVVADLWRAAGLRPGRAHDPADPEYRSHFHRFVELVARPGGNITGLASVTWSVYDRWFHCAPEDQDAADYCGL